MSHVIRLAVFRISDQVFHKPACTAMEGILSQTYSATMFLFDYFYVHAHALGKLFHLIKRSFSQATNPSLVLTIRIKLAKKQWILLMKGSEKN